MNVHEVRLRTGRGELTALRGGTPGATPLLALHGWLDNAASFVPLLPYLQAFDVVALDLPGHGGSAHRLPGYDYAFVDWLHDVHDVLDALDWPSAHVLGHSLGGAIASCMAAVAPERVQRLGLIEALGPLSADPESAGQRLRDAVQTRRTRAAPSGRVIADSAIALAARMAATPMPEAAARLIVERNLKAVDGGYAWRSDPRLTLPSAVRLPEVAVQSILRQIEAPTLLVAADPAPPFFTRDALNSRAQQVRDIQVEIIAGGHHLHMELPERIGPRLAAFFNGKD